MTKEQRAKKEIEVAGWLKEKGYDRRTWQGVGQVIVKYLDEHKLVSDGDLADVTSRLERLDEALFHATNFLADMHNSRLKSEGEPVLTPVGFDWLTDWQELVYNESREKTMIRAASK